MTADAAPAIDIERVRRDFPVLKREVRPGVPLIYLDNAATSQRPVQVIAEMTRFYRDHNANIHRGVHTLSVEATDLYEGARAKIAAFINAPDPNEVIYTRNTTESINLVAHGWGRKFLESGDEVVVTEIEHHSNIVPWQLLRDERGIVLKYIPMLPDGTIDMVAARNLIGPGTKLVGAAHMSNALGTILPIEELIGLAMAHSRSRTCRWTCRRSARTSSRSRRTRCWVRLASARCGGEWSCSRRWTRSWAAAR